jgi:ribosome-associated translation inhibitor RaiA
MKRLIDLKHVGPSQHVRTLLEELMDRLEDKLQHFPQDAVSAHAVFEENKAGKLHRMSLTCHVPGHVAAAHQEHRDAGTVIREAFHDVQRQLDKQAAVIRHEPLRRRASHRPFPVEASGSLDEPDATA